MNDKLLLSSYDNARSRTERLNRVVGYIEAKLPRITYKLISLHDHKGCLEVNFHAFLDADEILIFREVWESGLCTESTDNVEFQFRGSIISV